MREINPNIFRVNAEGYEQFAPYGNACVDITKLALANGSFANFPEFSKFIKLNIAERALDFAGGETSNASTYYMEDRIYKSSRAEPESTAIMEEGPYWQELLKFEQDIETDAFASSPHIRSTGISYQFIYTCKDGDVINLMELVCVKYPYISAPKGCVVRLQEELGLVYSDCMNSELPQEERISSMARLYYLQSHLREFTRGSATHARICMQVIAETIGADIPCTARGVNINLAALLSPIEVFEERFLSGYYFEQEREINPQLFEIRNGAYGKNPEFASTCVEITKRALSPTNCADFESLNCFVGYMMRERVEKLTPTKREYRIDEWYAVERDKSADGLFYKEAYGSLSGQHKAETTKLCKLIRERKYPVSINWRVERNNYQFSYKLQSGQIIPLTTIIYDSDAILYLRAEYKIAQVTKELGHLYERATSKDSGQEDKMAAAADFYYLLSHFHQFGRGSATHARICLQVIAEISGLDLRPCKKGLDINVQALCTPRDVFKEKFCKGQYFAKEKSQSTSWQARVESDKFSGKQNEKS